MDMPPMMRGRGSHPGIRPSSYQFHPDFFLYKGNMLNIVHYRIIPAIINTMPAHVREGFRGIMASRGPAGDGARDPERERKADVTAQRMRENATQLGFRAPNTGEKARACTYHLRAFLRSSLGGLRIPCRLGLKLRRLSIPCRRIPCRPKLL